MLLLGALVIIKQNISREHFQFSCNINRIRFVATMFYDQLAQTGFIFYLTTRTTRRTLSLTSILLFSIELDNSYSEADGRPVFEPNLFPFCVTKLFSKTKWSKLLSSNSS